MYKREYNQVLWKRKDLSGKGVSELDEDESAGYQIGMNSILSYVYRL